MTWLVFALIVAAASAYLYLSQADSKQLSDEVTGASFAAEKERIQNQLRELEYENSIGKMDESQFERLRDELLIEYESIEEPEEPALAVSAPETQICHACGAERLIAQARFCHACGVKFLQCLVMLFVFAVSRPADAFDLSVAVKNGTTASALASPIAVQLLKLEQGMQPIAQKTTTGSKVQFMGLPEMTAGPYMIQTVYQQVTYSRVIAPNVPSGSEVALEVFESTRSVENLKVRTLVELRRTAENSLSGLIIFFFVNSGKTTVLGGQNGLEFFLPPTAVLEQASISVGSGSSNIQWLKLSPVKTTRENIYSISQFAKPGDRILQVMFRLPYQASGTEFIFQNLYPPGAGLQLIAEPDNLEVRSGANLLSRVVDENLGRGLIAFNAAEKETRIALSKGSIVEARATNEEAEVEVRSPLSLTQKLIFPAISVALFAMMAIFRRRDQRIHHHS